MIRMVEMSVRFGMARGIQFLRFGELPMGPPRKIARV